MNNYTFQPYLKADHQKFLAGTPFSTMLIDRLRFLEGEIGDKGSRFSPEEIERLLPGMKFAIRAILMWERVGIEGYIPDEAVE